MLFQILCNWFEPNQMNYDLVRAILLEKVNILCKGFVCIFVSETRMWMILVNLPMFSGSRNAMRTVPTVLDHLAIAAILNFKMAALKTTSADISVSDTHRCMILAAIHMLSGSRNAIRTVPTAVDDLAVTAILDYKMATTKDYVCTGCPKSHAPLCRVISSDMKIA